MVVLYVIDDRVKLRELVGKALEECDMVLISGGSSVGMMDATADIIGESAYENLKKQDSLDFLL